MGCIITRTQQHMKQTPINAEYYLCDELKKRNKPQDRIRLNKLTDTNVTLHNSKESVGMDT